MEVMNKTILSGQIKKEHHSSKFVGILLILSFIGVAFYFSAQPASISGSQSDMVLSILKKMGMNFLTPSIVRKFAHFTLFGLIGSTIAFVISINCTRGKSMLFSFLITFSLAVADEIHQLFVPGRCSRIEDVIVDSTGALFGIYFTLLFISIIKNKLSRQS